MVIVAIVTVMVVTFNEILVVLELIVDDEILEVVDLYVISIFVVG